MDYTRSWEWSEGERGRAYNARMLDCKKILSRWAIIFIHAHNLSFLTTMCILRIDIFFVILFFSFAHSLGEFSTRDSGELLSSWRKKFINLKSLCNIRRDFIAYTQLKWLIFFFLCNYELSLSAFGLLETKNFNRVIKCE